MTATSPTRVLEHPIYIQCLNSLKQLLACCRLFDESDVEDLMVQKTCKGWLLPKGSAARWAYMTATNSRKALEHCLHCQCLNSLKHLLACCSPFAEADVKDLMVQKQSRGALFPKGFAARWAYMTATNPRKVLEHLMYLGLPMDPNFMQRQFTISKTRQQERRRGRDFSGRSVFQVTMAAANSCHCVLATCVCAGHLCKSLLSALVGLC